MKIPEETIENIRLTVSLEDIISSYTLLKKKGKQLIGLCPFHNERKPSFMVNSERQLFYCFGCGVGGNVFKFLMLKENMNFSEAVYYLAKRAGIIIPERGVSIKGNEIVERARNAHELAARFYYSILQEHKIGKDARNYLKSRGISLDMQEKFQLGFAPPNWDELVRYMKKQGYSYEELSSFGLAVCSERINRSFYDRFRNRLMFPICNEQGRVIGFGGRVLDELEPKYLNSPESVCFSKGKILYGLPLARKTIREKGFVLLMEGYLDTITAHQYGITNAVASLGTALTREQGMLLLRNAENVMIAYDSDAAGEAAAMRGMDLLQETGCRVRVITLPSGMDPDKFIRQEGVEAWYQLVEQANSFIEYKLDRILKSKMTIEEKMMALRQVLPNITGFNNALDREEGIKIVASRLSISWDTIVSELRKFEESLQKKYLKSDKIVKYKNNIIDRLEQSGLSEAKGALRLKGGLVPDKEKKDFGIKAEEELLKLIIENPQLFDVVKKELGTNIFSSTKIQQIYNVFSQLVKQAGYQPVKILDYLENEEQKQILIRILMDSFDETIEEALERVLFSIKENKRRQQKEQLLQEIREVEKTGKDVRLTELLKELQQIC